MFSRTFFLIAALWAAACSGQQGEQHADKEQKVPNSSKPQIPAALRGCWEMHEPPSEEYPNGLAETMMVKADKIIIDGEGVDRQVGTIELVERLTPTLIEGRITEFKGGGRATMATTLELDPEGAPPGTLLLQEGDAGSYHFNRCSPAVAAATERYSLVIAETAHQDDPQPAPCGPNGECGDFLYRAQFRNARVIAGAELPERFDARLKLHTPYISTYTLALIVERQKDGLLLVRRQTGFNGRNGVGCFRAPDEWPVDWKPEQVAAIRYERGDLCVFDKSQIDPNAPKE